MEASGKERERPSFWHTFSMASVGCLKFAYSVLFLTFVAYMVIQAVEAVVGWVRHK